MGLAEVSCSAVTACHQALAGDVAPVGSAVGVQEGAVLGRHSVPRHILILTFDAGQRSG